MKRILGIALTTFGSIALMPFGCGDSPSPIIPCQETRVGCHCQATEEVVDPMPIDCNSQVLNGALCCGSPDFPNSGTCQCLVARCRSTGPGKCACETSAEIDGTEVACPEGQTCCQLDNGACACDPSFTTCPKGATQVGRCTVATLTVCIGAKHFDSCSMLPN